MIYIREIKKQETELIQEVVQIHLQTFQGFFLTFMGKGFLRQMYRTYCDHTSSGLLAAVDENQQPVGFLAYSEDLSGLYKFMIRTGLLGFAWYSLGAFLRKPKVFMRLIRALLKPGESERSEAYVELTSIGVRPDVKSKRIGSTLIDELKSRVDFSKYAYISLDTDACDNDAVNRFYQKNGFVLARSFETREGRKMNEYRYRS